MEFVLLCLLLVLFRNDVYTLGRELSQVDKVKHLQKMLFCAQRLLKCLGFLMTEALFTLFLQPFQLISSFISFFRIVSLFSDVAKHIEL